MQEELSLPSQDRDFVEWHQGCPWCAVWVLMLDDAGIAQRVQQARSALGDVLLPRYDRQPHITLAYRGLYQRRGVGDGRHAAQQYDQQALQADVALLQSLALQPFAVRLAGVGSFATVPYLAVSEDDGASQLQRLHSALNPKPAPDWQYVPHVTVGHYARQLPLHEVLEKLHGVAQVQAPITLQIRQLVLARYATADIAGALWPEGILDLETGHFVLAPDF